MRASRNFSSYQRAVSPIVAPEPIGRLEMELNDIFRRLRDALDARETNIVRIDGHQSGTMTPAEATVGLKEQRRQTTSS